MSSEAQRLGEQIKAAIGMSNLFPVTIERHSANIDRLVALAQQADGGTAAPYEVLYQRHTGQPAPPTAPQDGAPAAEVVDAVIDERDLLPCPFCGSENVGVSIGSKADGQPWHYIECDDCSSMAETDVWNKRQGAEGRQPLSEERIAEIVLRVVYEGDPTIPYREDWTKDIGVPFLRAIEAAHGIGGKSHE